MTLGGAAQVVCVCVCVCVRVRVCACVCRLFRPMFVCVKVRSTQTQGPVMIDEETQVVDETLNTMVIC